jgi:hypothetical protein
MCQHLTTVKQYTLPEWCSRKLNTWCTIALKPHSLDCSVIVRIQYTKHRMYIQVDVKNLVKETAYYLHHVYKHIVTIS